MHIKICFIVLFGFFHLCFATINMNFKWNESLGDFVPILNHYVYQLNSSFRRRIQQLEDHKFQGEIIKLAYYEEKNLVNFYDKDSKVTGICGEVWNALSEYLNFTLFPIKIHDTTFGRKMSNGSYTGLLGILQRREVHVLPRVNYYLAHWNMMDYTIPVWENSAHIYNRPEYKSNGSWIFHLFTWRVRLVLALILILFSVLGVLSEKASSTQTRTYHLSLQDYVFYTFATFCYQGWLPQALEEKSKILELTKRIFSWFLIINLSTHLVSHMTNTNIESSFNDLKSLLNNTKYQVLVTNGSLSFERIKMEASRYLGDYSSRFQFIPSKERMTAKACWSKKKYAIIEADDRQQASGMKSCLLVRTGSPLFSTWTTNGIVKGFKYKRSFDIGIIKLHERGIIDILKDRWTPYKFAYSNDRNTNAIEFYHVQVLFIFIFLAVIASILICILENIIFLFHRRCKNKKQIICQQRRQKRLHAKRFLFITQTQLRTLKTSAKVGLFFK
ncbi:GSCOCG00007158001-RA-CDS [Cotesia congregata]|nr:GSCOCG00007158001-RA-CDS [Cotesia congregata]